MLSPNLPVFSDVGQANKKSIQFLCADVGQADSKIRKEHKIFVCVVL